MRNTLFILLALIGFLSSCETQKNDRELAERLNNEAVEQLQQQDYDKAKELLNAAIDADATYTDPYAYLIQINLNNNNFEEALKHSEVVIKKAPEEAENWVLAGILTEKKGDKKKAFSYYEESIAWFEKRLKEEKAEANDFEDHDLPLQNEINIIFSYLLLEEQAKANRLIEDLEKRFPDNAMIQNLYDFDKEMYLSGLFPEME